MIILFDISFVKVYNKLIFDYNRRIDMKNIVFITADQLGAAFVGCYGSGVDSTPTLDSLAYDGVRFDRCYATNPVCAPNRSTMLTGRCDEITGICDNNLHLPDDIPTIAHVLSQAGFYTGAFGKYHQTPMQFPLPKDLSFLGFHESALTEDTRLGQWLDEIRDNHPEYYDRALATSWPMPYMAEYGENCEDLRQKRIVAAKEHLAPRQTDKLRIMYESPLPAELCQTAWITDKALDFIDRNADKPFFCNVSYVDPHDPYDPPAPYSTMFSPEDMPEPIPKDWFENHWFDMHTKPFFVERIRDDMDAIKRLRALYHGSIRYIDDQIARIVKLLKEKGIWENTVIIFTTDHGDMMLDHELITKGRMHYDTSTRCPLIVGGGAIQPRAHVSDRLTCTLDLCPTFCDLLHIIDRPLYEGKSFARIVNKELPENIVSRYTAYPDGRYEVKEIEKFEERFRILEGGVRVTESEYKTLEYWDEITMQSSLALRSIITDDGYRLSVYADGQIGELFDLKNDPTEQKNLYNDTKYTELKVSLLERHIKAFYRHIFLPNYRNLKYKNGQRWLDGMGFNYFPTFTLDKDRE